MEDLKQKIKNKEQEIKQKQQELKGLNDEYVKTLYIYHLLLRQEHYNYLLTTNNLRENVIYEIPDEDSSNIYEKATPISLKEFYHIVDNELPLTSLYKLDEKEYLKWIKGD